MLSVSLTVPVSVQYTVPFPLATITSVYASAASDLESIELAIPTVTNDNDFIRFSASAELLEATMSYYSLLAVQATATQPEVMSSAAEQAAEASAVTNQLVRKTSFYSGNRPSLGGNLALLIVFSLFLILQMVFGVASHQWWFFVCFSTGIFLEVLGYTGRIWSHYDLRSFNAYVMQLVCITLAPCFLMAGIYYSLAQLTVIMGQHFSILKPMQYSLFFIICDLIAIVLQGAGGAIASSELSNHHSTRGGSNVMVVGLAFQVASMTLYQVLWFIFCYRCFRSKRRYGDSIFADKYADIRRRRLFVAFFFILTLAVILIFIRSLYRLTEMVEGFSGKLANDELDFMVLEALMVSLASFLLTVVHPGFAYGFHIAIEIEKGLKSSFSWKKEHYRYVKRDRDLAQDTAGQSTVSAEDNLGANIDLSSNAIDSEKYPPDEAGSSKSAYALKKELSREHTREASGSH
ncbi:hypothetical protein FOA43_001621 [Brettanomyces nanus]|uniref:Sphingoid long-chain base transporter RSB1 n=1 Tax=Eeniella nana TaxID=13502 RepID=A0A875S1T9_EENNA|nr:uncharacterized protein FOA43_001621 [Brettanomyces nanus]QPG74295.1 hypothetical protein FOA43_001621 [Brettanomyces nanus]